MNKKTTVADIGQLFPGATILEEGGVFALPLHLNSPELKLVMPAELPLGPGATTLLPGEFHATNMPEIGRALGTEFPVWIATGRFEEADDGQAPKFFFEDPLGVSQLLIAARWDLSPSVQTRSGLSSPFAEDYQACFFYRFAPTERQSLNDVLPNLAAKELVPALTQVSGLDFWVVNRTDFYCEMCEILSQNLRQQILLGHREHDSDTTSTVCRRLFESLAEEIRQDERLSGWKLVCSEANAEITMIDSVGKKLTSTIFYRPTFLTGIQDYIARAREGKLELPKTGW